MESRRPGRYVDAGLNARFALPGLGAQALHADWAPGTGVEPHYHDNDEMWLFTAGRGEVWPDDSASWLKRANASTLTVAHIETAAGYERAQEIVTTPHLDMVYVGPYDFSIALGHPGDYDHPEVKKAMRHILKLCVAAGVPFGTTASGPAAGAEWIAAGRRFFEVADELTLIGQGASAVISAYRR